MIKIGSLVVLNKGAIRNQCFNCVISIENRKEIFRPDMVDYVFQVKKCNTNNLLVLESLATKELFFYTWSSSIGTLSKNFEIDTYRILRDVVR